MLSHVDEMTVDDMSIDKMLPLIHSQLRITNFCSIF
jgi:hypothetical protein